MDQSDIRSLVLKAIYLDDTLSSLMVLKGGSAISLHNLTRRESYDLDFSLLELSSEDKEQLETYFSTAMEEHFLEEGYKVFQFKFLEKPRVPNPDEPDWGGYQISFKFLIEDEYDDIIDKTSKETVGSALSNAYRDMMGTYDAVKIELSKKEFAIRFDNMDLDGVPIKLYTPEMIIFEKLRAICQQMEEYEKRSRKAFRARDFFDIYTVNRAYPIHKSLDKDLPNLSSLLKNIFSIKEVPLELLSKIEDYRDFHRDDFESVKSVIHEDEIQKLQNYDFYVDETIKLADWISEKLV